MNDKISRKELITDSTEKNSDYFTVRVPKNLCWCYFILIVLFIFVGIAEFVQIGKPNSKMWVIISCFSACSCSLILWYCLAFKIIVDGCKIRVTRNFGFRKFSLNVDEIYHIKWKIISSIYAEGEQDEITVKSPYGNFSFGTMMVNSELMIAYILENVDKSKTQVIDKRKHKN